ncbi:MAG TPA: HepT-like ribonuclease domain-containing protein, partial [Bacillota bacterium]|nr:HepT-like ribonuclease domain-containing protein [Bacillota bacterium]
MVGQLRLLTQYHEILSNIKCHAKEEYLKDDILRGAAERYLQLAIETCINIGSRILSLEQLSQKF